MGGDKSRHLNGRLVKRGGQMPEEWTDLLGDMRIPPDATKLINSLYDELSDDERHVITKLLRRKSNDLERVLFLMMAASTRLM